MDTNTHCDQIPLKFHNTRPKKKRERKNYVSNAPRRQSEWVRKLYHHE